MLARAQALLGVPWREGAREGDADGALDCLGVVLLYLGKIGVDAPDPWDAAMAQWHDGKPIRECWDASGWRAVEEPYQDGDVISLTRGRHVAVYVGDGYLLTSKPKAGTHLLPLQRVRPHVDGAWRWQT